MAKQMTSKTLMYGMSTPKYKTVMESIWGMQLQESQNYGHHDWPRSMLGDYSDRHAIKRSALPDFTLDKDDGHMKVYYLMADTEGERASTYAQIMKSKDNDKWLKAMK
jgi:hypothetical protein